MLYSSPDYVWSQYVAWFERLQVKNADNLFAPSQNISLLGLVRKVSGSGAYPDWWLILGGLVLFALPYRRIGQYRYRAFRTMWLASVLMFVVLFSTGSESSTYIIPFVGICLWYLCVPWKRSGWDVALMVFAFVLTSLSPSDLFPRYVRETWVRPYALKALPVVLIWLKLVWEMNFRSYAPLPPERASGIYSDSRDSTHTRNFFCTSLANSFPLKITRPMRNRRLIPAHMTEGYGTVTTPARRRMNGISPNAPACTR